MAEHSAQRTHVSAFQWFRVGMRGLMELGVVLAFAYWGIQAGKSMLTKLLLGILAPMTMFGFWGLVDFRQAGSFSEALRLVQELIISGLAAVALFVAGQPILGWVMASVSIAYHALVYVSSDRLLRP